MFYNKLERTFGFVVALSFLWLSAVSADDSFGVPVYPGARFDGATTRVLKEKIHITMTLIDMNLDLTKY